MHAKYIRMSRLQLLDSSLPNCTFTFFLIFVVVLLKAKHSLSHRPLFKATVFIIGFGFTYHRYGGVITRAWTTANTR
ncbi:hypothetical protein DFP73DRAFT_551594 [Morchella snyderi]|nr:hypothetical protein DFP73DRAFT_551594 [Morchella snyderi]